MIIETSDNKFYSVVETGCEALSHVWYGLPVFPHKDGYALTAKARLNPKAELVRKAACRVVSTDAAR